MTAATIDECREAFTHATQGPWRNWPTYIDNILDTALNCDDDVNTHPTTYDATRTHR